MGITESLRKHGIRVFGPPPPYGAPKIESWKYVRRIYVRLLPFTVPLWVLIAVSAPTWLRAVLVISAAAWLMGFVSVSLLIWRLRNAPPNG